MTRPSPRPRHRKAEDEAAEPAPRSCKLCSKGEYRRGLCRGHWDSRRGDADPKEPGRA